MSQSEQVREAAQRVYVAALGRAHAVEAYGNRETAGASHSLDLAYDEWIDALDGYMAARTAGGAAQSTTDLLRSLAGEPELVIDNPCGRLPVDPTTAMVLLQRAADWLDDRQVDTAEVTR